MGSELNGFGIDKDELVEVGKEFYIFKSLSTSLAIRSTEEFALSFTESLLPGVRKYRVAFQLHLETENTLSPWPGWVTGNLFCLFMNPSRADMSEVVLLHNSNLCAWEMKDPFLGCPLSQEFQFTEFMCGWLQSP